MYEAEEEDSLPTRIPESELMSDEEVAHHAKINAAWLRQDTKTNNDVTIRGILESCVSFKGGKVLELGCGSATLSIRLALRFPNSRFVAVDANPRMLRFADDLIRKMGLSHRVTTHKAYLPAETFSEDRESFDLVFSESTLHHFADPIAFWRTVKDFAKKDGSIHVFDLVRPLSRDDAREWVGRCADWRFPKVHRDGYFRSFLAAYRPEEVGEQIRQVGLEGVKIEKTSPVHMKIWR